MTIKEILAIIAHRPWPLSRKRWKYYQEWNNAIFLHWELDVKELKKFVPAELEIDLFEGKAWVSLVAFTMEKIRLRNLPPLSPVSNFHEINIRTYVKKNNKAGVYFLSMEGSTKLSCKVAKTLSQLPYRHSKIQRTENLYCSENKHFKEKLRIDYKIGEKLSEKSALDKWLTERYALFQENKKSINEFEIHHVEWPAHELQLKSLEIEYPRYNKFFENPPNLMHYSPGVQVVAWGRVKNKRD